MGVASEKDCFGLLLPAMLEGTLCIDEPFFFDFSLNYLAIKVI